jgi:uncharacterized protein with ParB-like and HNH nuclease domain
MTNTITLYSISELLEMNFFIPSYQRGYRWTQQQVEDLLSDFHTFATKKNKKEKEFYCLQPIVVKKHSWKTNNLVESKLGWEVVDGQQRLTTIRILFTYLIQEHLKGASLKNEYGKNVFTIDYETRENTEYFLNNNIAENNDDDIDMFHISTAYQVIKKWFENKEKQRDVRESILRILVYNSKEQQSEGIVQVIWYQLEDEVNPIDTFIRINLGKIALRNSELIKALFLQERFFGKGNDDNQNETAKLRQLEIANEWDRIEGTLQNDDFWWFLNKDKNKIPARIEFIFDIIRAVAQKKDPSLAEKIGSDRFATFRYFSQEFDKPIGYNELKKEWDNVINYFSAFEEWYNNPVWYHYIGFLIYCGENIVDIYDYTQKDSVTQKEIKTKEAITNSLKKRIKNRFEKVKWALDENKESFLDLSYHPSDLSKIRELLLLFNLEIIVKQCEAKSLIYKFPFKSFKEIENENGEKTSWDVEHIDSFTTNPLRDRMHQEEWLKSAKDDIYEIKINDILCNRIDDFTTNKKSKEDFNILKNDILKIAGEIENDDATKNNIGNLTLLDAGTNRGYGNALFPTKRRKIIEKDKRGVFIPICTKNVFLKYFDTKGTSRTKWTIEDIKTYRNVITETLSEFLPSKPLNIDINE